VKTPETDGEEEIEAEAEVIVGIGGTLKVHGEMTGRLTAAVQVEAEAETVEENGVGVEKGKFIDEMIDVREIEV
jgi:hypothetical protein